MITLHKYFLTLVLTLAVMVFGGSAAWAQACSTAGHVQRDGGQILVCDGNNWQEAVEIENTGRQHLQIANDTGPCNADKTGRLRYNESTDIWQFCDGAGNWLDFDGPDCTNDMSGECFLDADRGASDPDFIADNITCGVNILGVIGTMGAMPDSFSFTDTDDVEISTLTTSNSQTITGMDCAVPVTIAGDGSPQFSINSGSWMTSGMITSGDELQLRLTSSASHETTYTATVTVGTGNAEWDVTTKPDCDNTPAAFSFTDETAAEPSTVITSNTIQITGFDCQDLSVSISGDGSPQFSVNGGSWVTSGTINSGDDLQLRLTSASDFETLRSATVTVGTENDQWNVTTKAETTHGYFVMTSSSWRGNLGGLSGANALCLTNLEDNNWNGKSEATLDSAHVFAFLCGGTTCNNLLPNTVYKFARSGDASGGGDELTTDSSGLAPNDSDDWSVSTKFNSTASYWTNRGTTSTSMWAATPLGTNHCTEWTDGSSTSGRGRAGQPGNTNERRWERFNRDCDGFDGQQRLICFVNP